jgi:hypothetical protein
MRELRPRASIQKCKKLLDTFNTEEIMWVKEYVEDRLLVDISFTYRPGHPDFVLPDEDDE